MSRGGTRREAHNAIQVLLLILLKHYPVVFVLINNSSVTKLFRDGITFYVVQDIKLCNRIAIIKAKRELTPTLQDLIY